MKKTITVLTAVAAFSCTSQLAAQDATFEGLGDLDGGPVGAEAHGVSQDGAWIVGVGTPAQGQTSATIWDAVNGLVALPDVPPDDTNNYNWAFDISDDGTVVVGFGEYFSPPHNNTFREAARWVNGSPQRLGFLGMGPVAISDATGVSADGSIIVGYSTFDGGGPFDYKPFRWETGVMSEINVPADWSPLALATGISADGSTIIGYGISNLGGYQGFYWRNGTAVGLGDLGDGKANAYAFGVSADGSVIVGSSGSAEGSRAFRWENGVMQNLGVIDGGTTSGARAVSDDGEIIVGRGNSGTVFIWDADNGMRDLRAVLEDDHGLDLSDWTNLTAYGISGDGTVIVGRGFRTDGSLEGWRAYIPRDADTDGDGLLDSWETDGLDINNDGIIDLDLPALGADPMRKDLFVEVDIMENGVFFPSAIANTITAFANAPVSNPDGSTGITLHVDWENWDTIEAAEFWDLHFVAFDIAKDQFFGTQAQRDDANWEHIQVAKKRAYRYCIFAHRLLGQVDGQPYYPSGRAELPGNDFIIALGGIETEGLERLTAITFMHELGHTLGLRHGGGDDIGYKPNYVSVMNYHFYDLFTTDYDNPPLDYSREDLATLDEAHLDENTGIASQVSSNVWMRHFYVDPVDDQIKSSHILLDGLKHDWNQDGVFEEDVEVDLNYINVEDPPSQGEELDGYNDWALLQLPIGTDGDFADHVHETIDYEEIDEDTIHWLQSLPPPPINVAVLNDLSVVFGSLLSGDVEGLVASDQNEVVVRSQPGFSAIEPDIMRIVIGATTDIENAAALNLIFEGRINHPNGVNRLLLRNWTNNQLVQQRQSPIGFPEVQHVVRNIPAANYIRADDGRIEVAVHQYVVAAFSALGFDSSIDRIEISVAPE